MRGRRFLVATLALLALALCWRPALAAEGAAGIGQERSAGEADLSQAAELYRAGRTDEALSLLRGLLVRHPDSPLVSEACLLLARIFHGRGQQEEALLCLGRIPAALRGEVARLLEGTALVGSGRTEAGLLILEAMDGAGLDAADRLLLHSVRAEGRQQAGRPFAALSDLHQALPLAAGERREALLRQGQALLQQLEEPDLAAAAAAFAGTVLGRGAALHQARRAAARGEPEAARRLVEAILQDPAPFAWRGEAVRLWHELTGETWLQRAVGVVLPLSGRYAQFGELVRRGMELALAEQGGRGRLLFRDAGDDPEENARAVAELAAEGVLAVAGPLSGAAAAAAADAAQREGLPLLTLSQREGLPGLGAWVFRNSLTPRQQVQALLRYATAELGMFDFAVLYPENRLGQEMAELFAREAQPLGARVVARQGFAEAATDFRRPIRLLQGLSPEAGAAAPPSRRFQALFIPDAAEQVGLIAPQLAYYGLKQVQLLGVSAWNSPELVRRGGAFVEGAVFVDGFFRHSPDQEVRRFVERYLERYGEEPSLLEAQGYDAAALLLSLLARPEVKTRGDLRLALSRVHGYPGVTGTTSFGPDGEARKSLFLLAVQDGQVVQLDWTPLRGEE